MADNIFFPFSIPELYPKTQIETYPQAYDSSLHPTAFSDFHKGYSEDK